MDPNQKLTARNLVNELPEGELSSCLLKVRYCVIAICTLSYLIVCTVKDVIKVWLKDYTVELA